MNIARVLILFSILITSSTFAQIAHVSVNQRVFELGSAPEIKLNIVLGPGEETQTDFLLQQNDYAERLTASQLSSYMLLVSGVRPVTDPEAKLIVREYLADQWVTVKQIKLFEKGVPVGKHSSRIIPPPVSDQSQYAARPVAPAGQAGCVLERTADETLWRISTRYSKEKGVSVFAAIMAIYDTNPRAFARSHINGLEKDAVLNCPSEQTINFYNSDPKAAKATFDELSKRKPSSKAVPRTSPVVAPQQPQQKQTPQVAPQQPVVSQTTVAGGQGCLVTYNSGDTLWRISSRYAKEVRVNVYAAIMAIYDSNPAAFVNGNINGLAKDAVLRCPTEAVVNEYNANAKEAQAQFNALSSGKAVAKKPQEKPQQCIVKHTAEENLWELASRISKVVEMDPYVMAMAIQYTNPETFNDGKIKDPLGDAILKCPTELTFQLFSIDLEGTKKKYESLSTIKPSA